MTPVPTAVRTRRASSRTAWLKWSLLGCLLNASAWLAAVLFAAGGPQRLLSGDPGSGAFFLLWPLVSSALMAGVVLLAAQAPGVAPRAAAGLVMLLLIATATSLLHVFTSQSSTAGLGLVTLPLIGVAIAIVGGLGVLAVGSLTAPRR